MHRFDDIVYLRHVVETEAGEMSGQRSDIDFDRLLKLRLVVARQGEMDAAKWWNTQGVLGPRGAMVYKRGFPSTHALAQAHAVFAVARSRCHELFDPPGCMTLWSLPAAVEDEFEERWQLWLDQLEQGEKWSTFFGALERIQGSNLIAALSERSLISEEQIATVSKLKRSAENRSVPLPGIHQPNDDILTLLAAGFARGEVGSPAIPYARLET
jgi:hypothetical protein